MTQKENALCPECGRAEITKRFIHKPQNPALRILMYHCGFCKAVFPLNTMFKFADVLAGSIAACATIVTKFVSTWSPSQIPIEADPEPASTDPTGFEFELLDGQGNYICDIPSSLLFGDPSVISDTPEMPAPQSFHAFLQERGDAWHQLITSKCFLCHHFRFNFDASLPQCRLYCHAHNEYWSLLAFSKEYHEDHFGEDCEKFRRKRPRQLKEFYAMVRAEKVSLCIPLSRHQNDEFSLRL
jgi:hypothetical protein